MHIARLTGIRAERNERSDHLEIQSARKWQSALASLKQKRMMASKTEGQIKILIYSVRRRVCAYIGFRVITTRPFIYLHKYTNEWYITEGRKKLEVERKEMYNKLYSNTW